MEILADKNYPLPGAAHYAGVTVSMLERWISSGEVEVRGTIDAESGEPLLAASELKAVRAFAIAREIADIIDQPQQWLDLPNPWMGGHSPRELIGTDREQLVIDVVEGIKHGIPS